MDCPYEDNASKIALIYPFKEYLKAPIELSKEQNSVCQLLVPVERDLTEPNGEKICIC